MTPAELAVLSTRLDAIHEDVREIKDHVQQTNGRVNVHDKELGEIRTWQATTAQTLVGMETKKRSAADLRRAVIIAGSGATVGTVLGWALHLLLT